MAIVPAEDPAVELTDVSKTFGAVRVLSGLQLAVRRGSAHALLGGNGSGKSTTLKILAGVHTADPGGVLAIHGRRYAPEGYSPDIARTSGLRFVHQDLGLVPDLTISENFALDAGYPRRRSGAIAWRSLHDATQEHLDRLEVDVDARCLVRDLRPSDRTLVAIARALRDSGAGSDVILVLDEPTASLPRHEVEVLLAAVRQCRDRGQTVVYVSHRLSEVLSLVDHVTVLRDGGVAGDAPASDLDESEVVEMMSGRPVRQTPVGAGPADRGRPVLRVTGLRAGPLRDVDFEVSRGEIVGIAGLLGSGRSTLLRTLFGLVPRVAGGVELDGEPVAPGSAAGAIRSGVALVPEDRAQDAAFADQTVWENVSATVVRRYWSGWRMARQAERRDAADLMERFAVHAPSPDAAFSTLSGGNQQKVVLARWFRLDPRVLLLDEPTQGVDAVARAEIHDHVRRHVRRGRAALVVSSDFEELESLCDRVLVLRDGAVVAEVTGPELTESALARLVHVEVEGGVA